LKIQFYRKSVLILWALAYVLLPFWQIGGAGVLRFDPLTLKLHFFGRLIWLQEFYGIMLLTLSTVLLFFLGTLLFGRIWCGWFCPQTIVCDLSEPLNRLGRKGFSGRVWRVLGLGIFSFIFAFSTVGYFVSPYKMIEDALAGSLGSVTAGAIVVLGLLLFAHLLLMRRTFCATICPYAKFQGAITDRRSLTIAMDEGRRQECVRCKRCVKVCPTGLDIRKGMQVGCIMCAACVDACAETMGSRRKKTLISYRFGQNPGEGFSLTRPGVIALFLLAMVPLTIFAYRQTHRTVFDFTVLPSVIRPRMLKDGEILNAYSLSIKNMTPRRLLLHLSIDGEGGAGLRPSIKKAIEVPAERVVKVPLFVRGHLPDGRDKKIVVRLRAGDQKLGSVEKSVYFVLP